MTPVDTACACMRYPNTVCINETNDLLCPECTEARCVVVEFAEGAGEATVITLEHVSVDDLIIDPFGPGALRAES